MDREMITDETKERLLWALGLLDIPYEDMFCVRFPGAEKIPMDSLTEVEAYTLYRRCLNLCGEFGLLRKEKSDE